MEDSQDSQKADSKEPPRYVTSVVTDERTGGVASAGFEQSPEQQQIGKPAQGFGERENKRFAINLPKKLLLALAAIFLILLLSIVVSRIKSGKIQFSGKKGEIVWWGIRDDAAEIGLLIEEYQKKNLGIKITYLLQSPKDYRERLTNALAKGEGPDIFEIHNSWVVMFTNVLDVLPEPVMSSAEFSAAFYPIITKDLTTPSGIVGIPLEYDALTLYVNEEILATAGKTPPLSWDELRILANDLTPQKGNTIIQSGIALGRTENVDHWQEILGLMMLQNRVDLLNPQGELFEDAIEFFTVFSTIDKVWSEILPPSTVAFANAKVAMYFGPAWRANQIHEMNPNLKFKTVPLPQLRKDDPKEPNVSYATYWIEGVWKKSINKDAAWKFLKFLSEEETLKRLYENDKKTKLVGRPYPRFNMAGSHCRIGDCPCPRSKKLVFGRRNQ